MLIKIFTVDARHSIRVCVCTHACECWLLLYCWAIRRVLQYLRQYASNSRHNQHHKMCHYCRGCSHSDLVRASNVILLYIVPGYKYVCMSTRVKRLTSVIRFVRRTFPVGCFSPSPRLYDQLITISLKRTPNRTRGYDKSTAAGYSAPPTASARKTWFVVVVNGQSSERWSGSLKRSLCE